MKNTNLTYEQFQKLAMQNYNKGGDGYVECWDEQMFNYYVSECGPITKAGAMRMFQQAYEIDQEERAAAAYFSGMEEPVEEPVEEPAEEQAPAGEWKVCRRNEDGTLTDIEVGVTKEYADNFCTANWGMWPSDLEDGDLCDLTVVHIDPAPEAGPAMNEMLNDVLDKLISDYNTYSELVALNRVQHHDPSITQWNSGRLDSTEAYMAELADILGVRLTYLFGDHGYVTPDGRKMLSFYKVKRAS